VNLKSVLVYGPELLAQVRLFERLAVIRVVQMMVVNWCQASQNNRAALKRPSTDFVTEKIKGAQRMTLDRKFLTSLQPFPPKVPSLGESPQFVGLAGESSYPRSKPSIEKGRVCSVRPRLELVHVDLMPLNERFYLSRAHLRILVHRNEPVIRRMRLK